MIGELLWCQVSYCGCNNVSFRPDPQFFSNALQVHKIGLHIPKDIDSMKLTSCCFNVDPPSTTQDQHWLDGLCLLREQYNTYYFHTHPRMNE